MRYHKDDKIDAAICELVSQGWSVEKRRHIKLRPPPGVYGIIVLASTPSDCRARANILARIARVLRGHYSPDRR